MIIHGHVLEDIRTSRFFGFFPGVSTRSGASPGPFYDDVLRRICGIQMGDEGDRGGTPRPGSGTQGFDAIACICYESFIGGFDEGDSHALTKLACEQMQLLTYCGRFHYHITYIMQLGSCP